jgi:hypothetical protein
MNDDRQMLDDLQERMNDPLKSERLQTAHEAGRMMRTGKLPRVVLQEVNNHVHTTYSFSPYEPTAAAFAAWRAGLGIVGSMDHDSVGSAEEMLEGAQYLGIASTVGFEVRCSFMDSPFANRKINNPDSTGIVYMCVHGIPSKELPKAEAFLRPIRDIRNRRNQAEVEGLNALIAHSGLRPLDFEEDVVPLSRFSDGGSITERHILSAFASRILDLTGKGAAAVGFLERNLAVKVEGNIRTLLLDRENPHYIYDLLGVLKSSYLPKFFIQPSLEECVDVREVVAFGLSIGAIPAYAYLGDIGQSITGDKKAEHFEDAYLEELVAFLAQVGFPAVTYMPPRNTEAQMSRLQGLCRKHNLMEISGVDINSSRQSFNCPEMLAPGCVHLVDSAWALVAHEKLCGYSSDWGLFSASNPLASLSLQQRIGKYAQWGREMDPFDPDTIIAIARRSLSKE